LPYSALSISELTNIHINQTHWTPKPPTTIIEATTTFTTPLINPVCEQGRVLIDSSNGPLNQVLNTPDAKLKAINRYGKTSDPLITDIITTWHDYIVKHNYTFQDCRIFKDDVSDAFGQLEFHPDSCKLMIVPIDLQYILIQLFGNLGWTGLPMAWGLVKRSILFLTKKFQNGILSAYVDDFIGFSHTSLANSDQSNLHKSMRNILGDNCIKIEKSVPPTLSTDVLGWFIDLNNETIRPSDKGIDKLLFAFFFIDVNKSQNLKTYQLLSSLAERYSLAILGMRAFVSPIQSMMILGNDKSKNWSKIPTSNAKFCIEIWRLVSILLWLNPNKFSVKLTSISKHPIYTLQRTIISDAGPTQICSALYFQNSSTLQCYTKFKLPFIDHLNLYQNIREYIGLIICLILLKLHSSHTEPCFITWNTDSSTALSWAESNKVKSLCGQAANLATIWFQIYSGYHLSNVVHIPGITMDCIDRASRNLETTNDFQNVTFINLQNNIHLTKLMSLINPTNKHQNCTDHHSLYIEIHNTLQSLLNTFTL